MKVKKVYLKDDNVLIPGHLIERSFFRKPVFYPFENKCGFNYQVIHNRNDLVEYTEMDDVLKNIHQLAELTIKLREEPFFDELSRWQINDIHRKCKIVDGKLFNSNNELLSNNGDCMNESIPYFVNQSTGYCCDDYYGRMFVKVDEIGTFVEIYYEC